MCWNAQAWSTSGQFWQTPGLRLHVGSMSRCGAVGTSFVARPQQNAAAAAAPGIPTRSSRSCHLRRDCNAQACRSSFASASVVTVGWNDDAAQQGTESQCFLFPLAFECLGLAPGFGATPEYAEASTEAAKFSEQLGCLSPAGSKDVRRLCSSFGSFERRGGACCLDGWGFFLGIFYGFFLYFLWFSVRQTRESVSWLTADRAVSQSESQPSDQSVGQPTERPVSQSVSRSSSGSGESVSQSVRLPTEPSISRAVDLALHLQASEYGIPESPNEGACLRYMMNRNRQKRGRV